jgi:hypothetical protein
MISIIIKIKTLRIKMAIIITMAGEGKRARKMFNTNLPKFEIKINNKSFF